jgi:hypothetical protein
LGLIERSIYRRKGIAQLLSEPVALLDDFWPYPLIFRHFANFQPLVWSNSLLRCCADRSNR